MRLGIIGPALLAITAAALGKIDRSAHNTAVSLASSPLLAPYTFTSPRRALSGNRDTKSFKSLGRRRDRNRIARKSRRINRLRA